MVLGDQILTWEASCTGCCFWVPGFVVSSAGMMVGQGGLWEGLPGLGF